MDLMRWFPRIIAVRVSYPFDQVLERPRSPMTSVAHDAINFIFFFSINQFWRWFGKV
jgi:hypothetical protein